MLLPSSSRRFRPVSSRYASSRVGFVSDILVTWSPFERTRSMISGEASSPISAFMRYSLPFFLTSFTRRTLEISAEMSGSASLTPTTMMSPPTLAFSCSGVPTLMMCPWSMIAILSQSESASSR